MNFKFLVIPPSIIVIIHLYYYHVIYSNNNINNNINNHNLCNEPQYEYYKFSLKKCDIKFNNTKSNFSIHGLWPQFSRHRWPQFCKHVNFTIDDIDDNIKTELDKKWYSCYESNFDFWNHEIEKHYSCMFSNITINEYFKTGLNVYDLIMKNEDKYCNEQSKKLGICSVDLDLDYRIQNKVC